MQLAEQRVYQQAENMLPRHRLDEMRSAAGVSLFVAGRYPSADWEAIAGFVPDKEFHYEVVVGIAVEPGVPSNLFAKVLISRDVEEDLCLVLWDPSQNAA